MRQNHRVVLHCLLAVHLAGCFQEIDVPACAALADCPAGPGYAACESGLCFVRGRCDGASPLAGDACCPRTEGDRSADSDCLLLDEPLGMSGLAAPLALRDGQVLLAGVALDPDGTSRVRVRRLGPDGTLSRAVPIGPGLLASDPAAAGPDVAYVAFRDGVARVHVDGPEVERIVESGVTTGGAAAFRTAGGTFRVGWPTAAGEAVVYDEASGTRSVLPAVPGGLSDPTGFVPVVAGDRMVFSWRAGAVASVDLAAIAVASSWESPRPLAAAPVPVGEVLATLDADRVLRGLVPEGAGFGEAWSRELPGPAAGGPLTGTGDLLLVALRDGRVLAFGARDGRPAGQADFGASLADLQPVRCPSGRLVAVASAGAGVRTLLPVDPAAGAYSSGLRFDVPSPITSAPCVAGDRLYVGKASDRLVAWWFPEGPDDVPASVIVQEGDGIQEFR
jgi:hypothetical protein